MIYYNEFLKSRKSHTQWRNTEAPANILLLLSKRTAERMLNRCLQAGEYVPPLRWRGAPEALTHEQTLSVVKRCHLLIQTYGLLTSRMITGEALDVARQPLPNETKAQTFSRWNRCGGKDWRKRFKQNWGFIEKRVIRPLELERARKSQPEFLADFYR